MDETIIALWINGVSSFLALLYMIYSIREGDSDEAKRGFIAFLGLLIFGFVIIPIILIIILIYLIMHFIEISIEWLCEYFKKNKDDRK
jgi:uncharacterized membrane protein